MAYIDIHGAATEVGHILRKQVAVACMKAATDIFNESAATDNHANRIGWARAVRDHGPDVMAATVIWTVLENATIQAAPMTALDSDVQFVVNALVNTFANGV